MVMPAMITKEPKLMSAVSRRHQGVRTLRSDGLAGVVMKSPGRYSGPQGLVPKRYQYV